MTTVSAGANAQPVSAGSDRLLDMGFAEFFRAEYKKLIRFVTTMGANSDQAAEIAQETFFKALLGWDSIRTPRAWIRRVAANELTAARRAVTPRDTAGVVAGRASARVDGPGGGTGRRRPPGHGRPRHAAAKTTRGHGMDHRRLRRRRDRPRTRR